MCKRTSLLISFVLLLNLSGDLPAKDLNPPDFAGGNQTGVVFWEFDEDNDQPTSFQYRPRSRVDDEEKQFGFRYYDDSWQWQEGGYLAMVGSEESLVMPMPAGDGANLRGYMQVVWEGQLEDPPLGVAPEIWLDYEDEFLNEEEFVLEPIKNIKIGNQRWYTIFEWTLEDWDMGLSEATHFHLIWNLDTDYKFRLDEVIVDLVIFDGTEPPRGPGRVGIAPKEAKDAVTHPAAEGKDKPPTLDTDPHLMGWWKFDETTGKTASDSSKHKRKGTLDGDLTFDKASVDGRVGKALKLESDDAIDIKGYKGVTGTSPRTVTTWIKTTQTRGNIVVWGERDSGKHFRFAHIRGRIGVTPHGGYYYMKEYINDNKWHHLAVVVKESDLPNLHDDIVLYLDGEVAIIDDIGLLDLLPLETAAKDDVRIGEGYEGLIDELRIYSRALSIDEIKAIYRGRSYKPLAKQPGVY